MKRKRFSVEQIVAIVKQAEMGMPVAELIRRVGVSEQSADTGERESAFSTRSCPRSMRLAMSTSPSRVSRGTPPR